MRAMFTQHILWLRTFSAMLSVCLLACFFFISLSSVRAELCSVWYAKCICIRILLVGRCSYSRSGPVHSVVTWMCDKSIAHAYRRLHCVWVWRDIQMDSPTIYSSSLPHTHSTLYIPPAIFGAFFSSSSSPSSSFICCRSDTAPMSWTFFFLLFIRYILRQLEMNIWRSWRLETPTNCHSHMDLTNAPRYHIHINRRNRRGDKLIELLAADYYSV